MEKSDIIIIILLAVMGVIGIQRYGERMKANNDEKSFGYWYMVDRFNEMKADNIMFKEEIQMLKSTIKSLDLKFVQQSSTKKSKEVAPRRRLNSKPASAEVALLNDNAIIRMVRPKLFLTEQKMVVWILMWKSQFRR